MFLEGSMHKGFCSINSGDQIGRYGAEVRSRDEKILHEHRSALRKSLTGVSVPSKEISIWSLEMAIFLVMSLKLLLRFIIAITFDLLLANGYQATGTALLRERRLRRSRQAHPSDCRLQERLRQRSCRKTFTEVLDQLGGLSILARPRARCVVA